MIFDRFESLLSELDNAFKALKKKFPLEVLCRPGCDDCCSAFFDLSYIEAEYVRLGLSSLNKSKFAWIEEQAELAKRKTAELLAEFHSATASQEGAPLVGNWRVRCPLLTEEKKCAIYKYRPATCRVYGLPTSIGDKGHVCGFSGFDMGSTYPTIKLDKIGNHLQNLSEELAAEKLMSAADAKRRIYIYEVVLGQ